MQNYFIPTRDPRLRYHGRSERRPAADAQPSLLIVVDTEEEFDWDAPFDRASTAVSAMRHIERFQAVCDDAGARPTYVVTYPVATQEEGFAHLVRFREEGRASIGSHQHPWTCPPFDEIVSSFHSYPGNLPEDLERAKLVQLTRAIETSFGFRPTIYKAGRYGFGFSTARILEELGYEIDLSPSGPFNRSKDGGPDDRRMPPTPFVFGDREDMACFPISASHVGWVPQGLQSLGYDRSRSPLVAWTRLPGVLARTRAIERLQLSPEGYSLDDMKRLTRHMLRRGERHFSMALHSPTVVPGLTEHTHTKADVADFLMRIRGYLDYFAHGLGGRLSTPHELRAELASLSPASVHEPQSTR